MKNKFRLGYELKVEWISKGDEKLAGEVRGGTIYIYDKDEKETLETLDVNFWIYAISKL